jgi:hypothetical protein
MIPLIRLDPVKSGCFQGPESVDRPTESVDRPTESVYWPHESVCRPPDSVHRSTESVDRLPESSKLSLDPGAYYWIPGQTLNSGPCCRIQGAFRYPANHHKSVLCTLNQATDSGIRTDAGSQGPSI